MLELGEAQTSLHTTKEISELLYDTLSCLHKERQKKVESNIQSFITSRIDTIKNNELPIEFESDTKAIFHLIPLNVFEQEEQQLDISVLQHKAPQLPPFGYGAYDYRYNYDGYLTHNKNVYTQVFRNGCIEAVSDRFFNVSEKKLFASRFESSVIDITSKYIKVLNELGIKGPFRIHITLVGTLNYNLELPFEYFVDHYRIDKNEITLPRVAIEEEQQEQVTIPLKKAFDVLWNAGGVFGSINYKNGEWKPSY